MTDRPTDDSSGDRSDDDAPIEPEVVRRRGAAARKRRPGDVPPVPSHEPEPGRSVGAAGSVFRIGCILLTTLGVLEVFVASQLVLDPDGARCTAAQFAVDAANDDDEDFNDVTLPDDAEDAGDIACDDAIALAAAIPSDEGEEADGTFPAASSFSTQGLIISGLGIGHAVTGFLTLRTRRKPFRTAALVFIAFGLFLPALGIISLVILAFAVYALLFSADAKAIFGGGSGFLRPRFPPASG